VVGGDACADWCRRPSPASSVQLDSLAGADGCDVTVYHGIEPGPTVNSNPPHDVTTGEWVRGKWRP
jgi:hypothetical protein